MASYQYVYHMDGVSKTYPGGKKCFENIRLNFLPGVKIGVVGVNGAGKSTLMRIMSGQDKDFTGEAWAAEGAKVGYLPQEPELDPAKTVRENVMEGVAAKKALLDEFNDIAMRIAEDPDLMDQMTALQDRIRRHRQRCRLHATRPKAKSLAEPSGRSNMASYQYVYHMDGVSKTYPGGKKCFENIPPQLPARRQDRRRRRQRRR